MDQFSQTNDLQQAINNAANNADINAVQDQFGVPPVPPMPPMGSAPTDELPPIAPVDPMPIAPPMPKSAPEAAADAPVNTQPVEPQPLVPPEEPKAEVPATKSAAPEVVPESTDSEEPAKTEAPAPVETPEVSGDLAATRENILKDLMPLMDKVESTPEEKYMIYKDAMETLHDKNLITSAYKAASKIEDENKKAEALIELMKAIDNV